MEQTCRNHSNNKALTSCRSCLEFFCGDCLMEGEEYYYCKNESCQIAMKEEQGRLVPTADPPSDPSVKLITIAKYSQPYEADLARARLEAEGILVFLADEFLVHLNWLYSNAIGGIRLQVAEPDAELAREILSAEPNPDSEDSSAPDEDP